jgi:ATP-binding cassette, subfamily B, bacterial MsbA
VIALAIYQSQIATPGQLVTAGVFTGIISSMVHLFQPLKQLANMNGAYARTQAAAGSVFEFLDQLDERQDTGTQPMPQGALTITVEQLSVQYAGSDVPALSDVSFTLAAGKTTTLLGRSGSGKSTFAALLPRLIEPSLGRVCINGVNLKDIRLSELRGAIAMVTQESVLVDDTVAANVAYGEAAPDEARLWTALEAASMAGTVRDLPNGLQTMVGEGGSRFSGGQRQRLTIARAFYKNAPLLILDEATSALDVESEASIQAALKSLMQGRTTLVITHRLNTIAPNSHLIVLDAGRMIEQGSNAELLAKNGAYAALLSSNETL